MNADQEIAKIAGNAKIGEIENQEPFTARGYKGHGG